MPGHREQASQVLAFWFSETLPRQWFAKDLAFDALVGERFLGLTRQAIAGELDAWSAEPTGALALVLCCSISSRGRSGAIPPWPSLAISRPWR